MQVTPDVAGPAAALIEAAARRQLPRVLRDKLSLYVMSDPWHARVRLRLYRGCAPLDSFHAWDVEVEPEWRDGMLASCTLPERIYRPLCVEVP